LTAGVESCDTRPPEDQVIRKRLLLLTFCSALFTVAAMAPAVSAHHSNSAYDTGKTVTIKGTVAKWQLMNPHSGLWLEIKTEQGTTELWAGEFTGTLDLYRKFAWNRATFKPGDQITLIGNPARDGATSLMARKVVFADGKEVDLAGT
jgi:hypothetical protein